MKKNDWNKKRITFLYGKKNLISTLGICDLISKKPTYILSPINQESTTLTFSYMFSL